MDCCKPEQVYTKEYGNMLKRIQVFEDGRVPADEARNWKIEGHIPREKSVRGFLSKFEMEGFMAQKGLWNLAGENVMPDREALPKDEGDVSERMRPCRNNIS